MLINSMPKGAGYAAVQFMSLLKDIILDVQRD